MSYRSPKPAVRVLILDTAARGRAAMKLVLDSDGAIEVVGSTGNSELAVSTAATALPDVIAIGHRPASTDALLAIRHIMHVKPLPIVVVSPVAASSAKGTLAFDLLEAGALAVVHEPWSLGGADRNAAAAQLLQMVKLMAEVKVVRRWRKPAAIAPCEPVAARPLASNGAKRIELVAIGASTGGPVVLKNILSRLPKTFPLPIVIVQHISSGFVDGLAQWLSLDCPIPVQIAVTGEALRRGHAYLAPDGSHMRLAANGTLALDREGPVNGHRPAVSCLFRSVAQRHGPNAIGILLTGMGQDGVAELKLMREAGAITIAQDQASSVVHGMPGEAIRRQAASHVMSPDEIAAALPALATR